VVKGDYFLFFGRLSAEKGIRTLLSVFSERKDQKLIIAGTGPLKSYVEDTVRISPNIEYVGYKSGKELESLINNASFIILPSEWYENNPLTIIEAYNFGKPVIGADIGGIPELINDGANGFTFESGNPQSLNSKIDASITITGEAYERFAQSVSEFARQNFNSENHYLKLLKIYMDVINKKNSK
jgi:glycosyltransferase involved in cell wall biosynthesis